MGDGRTVVMWRPKDNPEMAKSYPKEKEAEVFDKGSKYVTEGIPDSLKYGNSGKIEDIRIIRNKKQIPVNQAGEILGISEKLKHTKKLQLQLKINDILILQTDGAVYNSEEDDKTIVMITRKS